MYLETMDNVYKNSRKVIVDTKGAGNMLYLPLDKLLPPVRRRSPGRATRSVPQRARCRKCRSRRAEDPARARGVR